MKIAASVFLIFAIIEIVNSTHSPLPVKIINLCFAFASVHIAFYLAGRGGKGLI